MFQISWESIDWETFTNRVAYICDYFDARRVFIDFYPSTVAGIIRLTLGKARLVVKKRLTHFEQLCNNQIVSNSNQ